MKQRTYFSPVTLSVTHSLCRSVRVAAFPLEFSLIMPSEWAPVACFASAHGLNSFPTYILVFTSSSRCLLHYLFHFLVESDRFNFKIVHRDLFAVAACRKVEVRGRHVSRASREYLARFQQLFSKHILG